MDIIGVLDQLEAADFKRFKMFLQERTLPGFNPIPRGRLENCDSTDVAIRIKDAYGKDGALVMIRHILVKMGKVYLLEFLS